VDTAGGTIPFLAEETSPFGEKALVKKPSKKEDGEMNTEVSKH